MSTTGPSSTLAPSTRLGPYEIRTLLGEGGMGSVYLVYDRDLKRRVALKLITDERGAFRGRSAGHGSAPAPEHRRNP